MNTPLGQADAYKRWLQGQGLSLNTITQRLGHLARIQELGDIADMDAATVAEWLTSYNGWTRRTYQASANSIFTWARRAGLRDDDPVADMKKAPPPRPRPKPLSDAEVARALANSSGDQHAWLLLALLAGLRAHEIAKIRGEDITESWLMVVGKGGSVEEIETHPDLWALAQTYPRIGPWFPEISAALVSNRTGAYFRAIGIVPGSIHRLRATFGTRLINSGEPLQLVQSLLRHKSLQSTQHYLGIDVEARRRAIHRLSGVA